MSRTITRPDTLYLFAHIEWRKEIAEKINAAYQIALGPKARSFLGRVEQVLSECDPFEAERLRTLPWHELVEEVYARESQNGCSFSSTSPSDSTPPAVTLSIGGFDFSLIAYSPRRGCNFQLIREGQAIHARVGAARPQAPNCYLEIGSAPLWMASDWTLLLKDWQKWLFAVGHQKTIDWHISRVDIAFHTQELVSSDIDRQNFCCRADTRRVYSKAQFLADLESASMADDYARKSGMEVVNVSKLIDKLNKEAGIVTVDWFKGEVPQMIGFGTRGRLYSRIYNKTRELSRSPIKNALFTEIYEKSGFDLSKEVINVEFELCRSWLKSREFIVDGEVFTIDTLSDLFRNINILRAYLLGSEKQKGWLFMIDRFSATRKERCEIDDGWELLREATSLLPEITAKERERLITRATASRVLPAAVRLKARLDSFLGRNPDPENITLEAILESMAEILLIETDRKVASKWSDFALVESYKSERIKLISNQIPQRESA